MSSKEELPKARHLDKILIKNLVIRNVTDVDSWQRLKSQPVIINVWLQTDITAAGDSDLVKNSIHYGHVTKGITKLTESKNFRTLEELALKVVSLCCVDFGAIQATVRVEQPKALLHAAASGVEVSRLRTDFGELSVNAGPRLEHEDMIFVKDLRLHAIIGVNPWEREEKQVVIINLTIYPNGKDQNEKIKCWGLRTIVRTLSRHIESSGYKTVEAFAVAVARLALEKCHVNKIRVRIEKPSAILFADASGIEVTRDAEWLRQVLEDEQNAGHRFAHHAIEESSAREIPTSFCHTAYIAIGSNIGDRVGNIYEALDLLEKERGCIVVDTSFLYETPPMYYTEQPAFLNAVCKIATNVEPHPLLAILKSIEGELGRKKSFRNAPRPIDLDILFYNDLVMESDDLIIPHTSIQERTFVLRPLCDIARDMEHPKLYKTCGQLLSQLLRMSDENAHAQLKIEKVIPIQRCQESALLWNWNEKTFIMGILNTTPDSFSDGGEYIDVEKAVEAAERMRDEGANVIDIGGMSTRPGADDNLPEEEEIRRVVSVIKRLREKTFELPISIDTFRASVAEAALEAGATMINDITGGTRDPDMLAVMAKHKVPVCLMHMRGTSKTMMVKENVTYENDDVVIDISYQLHSMVQRAIAAGVYRWNIILDPGIGFAKTPSQDFEILRRFGDMMSGHDSLLCGFPSLVGPSRKKFVGFATDVTEAKERSFGTAGAVAASIAGGANILRVHDVRPMWEVARVCDSVWIRGGEYAYGTRFRRKSDMFPSLAA